MTVGIRDNFFIQKSNICSRPADLFVNFLTGLPGPRIVLILIQRKVLTKLKIIVIIRYQKKGDKEMKNYLFYDYDSGENFIVETENKEKAYMIAYTYFKEPKFCEELSDLVAEILGYDTY